MTNLRSDARDWLKESGYKPGSLEYSYITRLCFQIDQVEEDMANAIPNLKELEVIVTGKAFKAKTPMIMKLKEKEKPLS